ncbi:histidine phosphatase family protein [Corynebacterium breve]|uniref:Histidine phosphatase family protein n=1 Tax=Corynebacterium breve TaxID=3049799 RepID=A0ABY8VCI0_9CORY|nr:histidine phosphatase family protein [Corynebacterium breve]WIM67154.1 histidine phosphatase family protein [Corynebacterium breve]
MRRLIMLRHGQTDYNAGKRMQGQLDTQLSETGVQQAHLAADVVESLGVVKILSSDLTRAKDTADIIAQRLGLDVVVDKRLRETHLGQWQGKTHGEVDRDFAGMRASWRHNPEWAPPGGESRVEVARRARPVVEELMRDFSGWDDNAVLIVAHGGTISAVTSHLLGLSVEQYPMFSGLRNTNYSQLIARPKFTPGENATQFNAENVVDAQWYLDAWNQGLGG